MTAELFTAMDIDDGVNIDNRVFSVDKFCYLGDMQNTNR